MTDRDKDEIEPRPWEWPLSLFALCLACFALGMNVAALLCKIWRR